MPIFKLHKLVRDRIPEDQISLGETPHVRQLDPEEHCQALIRKIIEETGELLNASREDSLGEIRDVQQALDDLIALRGLTKAQIVAAQAEKNAKSGNFSEDLFIETLETAEDDPWTVYYRQEPERFPEI